MDTFFYLIGWVAVVAGFTVSAVLLVTLAADHVRQFIGSRRGIPTDVLCPETGQPVKVRIGADHETQRLTVLSCSRFPSGPLRCSAPCFPSLSSDELIPAEIGIG